MAKFNPRKSNRPYSKRENTEGTGGDFNKSKSETPYGKSDDEPKKRFPQSDGEKKPFAPRGEGGEFPKKRFNRFDKPEGRFEKKSFTPRGEGGEFPKKRFNRFGKPEGRFEKKSFPPRGEGGEFPKKRFSRFDKPEGRFEKKPFAPRGEGGEFPKKRFNRFGKPEGRFEKKPFTPRGEGGEFPKKRFNRFGKPEGRFEKKPFTPRGEGGEFPKKRFNRFDKSEGRFEKKPFSPRGEGGEFPKKRFNRFDKSEGRFEKKPFSPRGEGGEFPKKRFNRFDKPEGRFEKKSFAPRREGGEFKKSNKSFNKSLDIKKVSKEPPAPVEKAEKEDGLIRLNKFLANSGVESRRHADELIKMGLVTVNGEVITAMGFKVKPSDEVRYEGRRVKAEALRYILLNKPKGTITTADDPQERHTVMQLVEGACKERIYPVGRLDRNTTGLLLLTNDGELAEKLTHPSYNVKKIYKAELDRPITQADAQRVIDGVYLEEGRATVDDFAVVSEDKKTVGIELHIGWNRIVRRIFEKLEYEVVKLDRVVYAGLDKKNIGRGEWRFLTNAEVGQLKKRG